MNVCIVDNGSIYIDELTKLVSGGNDVTVVNYGELTPNHIDDDTLLILSGGHNLPVLWHKEQFRAETDLVNSHKGPIIGICLGFQLLAHVFGSHLHLLDERRKGSIVMRPTDRGLGTLEDRAYIVYENHRWAAREVEKPLVALARSSDGVEFFKHVSRPIYATQFHPESSTDIDGDSIFETVLSELKASILL